jgi:diguanylate cyclase (GGDEF)-like protein/PAS domain S-box-containing protein
MPKHRKSVSRFLCDLKRKYQKMTKKVLTKHVFINLHHKPLVFDFINNGITITDKNSSILYTNPTFTTITGYSKEEALGENPAILHSGRHDKKFFENMWKDIVSKGFWEGEIWNRRKSGEVYPEYLTISKLPQGGEDDFLYIAVFSDISYLKKDITKKLHLAFYDPLSELPNRSLFLDRVNQSIENAKNDPDKTVAIFYMDLDKFKHVNDTYGHCVGDELLKLVGKRLSSIIRAGDTIARVGGDEFTALLTTSVDKLYVSDFAQRIFDSVQKPFMIDGNKIDISISIGISFYPQDANTVDQLLIKADKAMYIAKRGGIKIVSYEPALKGE